MEVVVKSDVADPKQQQQLLQNQHFHVLAVDDSLLDRKLLERLLRGSSYEVTCVDSGDEALKYLGLLEDLNRSTATSSSSSSPPSSDVPEGSSWKDVPVVVMSSENVPSRISMCLEEGAEEFLLKPLQLSDLKKLRPYLLKSLQHYYSSNHNEAGGENDQNDQTKSATEMNHVKGATVNSNSISKRKAQTISERSRPKMKGLGVLGPNNIREIKAQDEGTKCSRPKQYQRDQGPR
ncbi:hypothetical protein C1H46_043891 [Malus baccata]|uniref:Response regulatory domain-containing protein n=1 Tax=Malus baccata TaxID=106549 RepID=A0A540K8M4_MALBA|nr:hypothetical protein C1H46_043891 [Malus baccata]